MWPERVFLILSISLSFCRAAKILGVFVFPSYSHQIVFQPIYKELSLRGHEVIVVTPNPLNDSALTNLTEIDTSYLYKYSQEIIWRLDPDNYKTIWSLGSEWISKIVEEVLRDGHFARIYKDPKQTFDLVIVEAASPLLRSMGVKFRAPEIGILSVDGTLDIHRAMGNPIHPALFGDPLLSVEPPMPIYRKIMYCYYFVWLWWHYNFVVMPKCDLLAKKYFGDDFPPIAETEKKLSMVFLNTNYFMSPIRPCVPAVVSLGFMHIKPVRPLPVDLQQILDNSNFGVVYFSLGSNVLSIDLPLSLRKIIVKALSDLPYTVLWKWESDIVPEAGRNIITRKWFPQQDILAHRNIKVFLTQGGLQSCEEAIFKAVPVVGLPFISDQRNNLNMLVKLGAAVSLSPKTLTVEVLREAILEVAQKPKYVKQIRELSTIAKDQPMTGLERAIWWSEYVIRHKGAQHLRSIVADTPIYEYLMLDVIALVLVGFVFLVFGWYKILTLFIKIFKHSTNERNTKKE